MDNMGENMSNDDRPSIAELQQREQEIDRAPWYSAESRRQSDCVLTGAPGADFTNDGRDVVQANPNFPYRANLDGVAALRNAAPVLLEIAAAALAYRKAKKTAAKTRHILYQSAFPDSMSAESEAQDKEEIRCRHAYDAALDKVRE
jgi:hypothetical protein